MSVLRLRVNHCGTPAHRVVVRFGDWAFPGAVGRQGIRSVKREGDGCTPRGSFPIRRVWWRPDRLARPRTALPLRPIGPTDLWCDAPGHRRYNRPVRAPFAASHETLTRDDHLYDIVVELGYNDHPAITGRGSAIFLHAARPGLLPTEGCLALDHRILRRIVARLRPGSRIVFG